MNPADFLNAVLLSFSVAEQSLSITPVNILEAVVLVFSVAGQEFISRRNRRGFILWLVSNVCGIITFSVTGRWIMVALYLYFSVKCFQGLRHWKLLEQEDARKIAVATIAGPLSTMPFVKSGA